jgi:hypothetical protein
MFIGSRDGGFTGPETLSEDEELEVLQEAPGVTQIALDVKGDHTPSPMLLPGKRTRDPFSR